VSRKRSKKKRAWQAVLRRDPCAYCGEPSATLDHILPQARGGFDHDNTAGACEACNRAKGSKPLLLYLLGQEPR
jgi:5-methylcytosine-specific restriction endonuclease McrA